LSYSTSVGERRLNNDGVPSLHPRRLPAIISLAIYRW
jgi:hypothetical protein